MDKKLPEVFHNTINKRITNNEDVYYSANKEVGKKIDTKKDITNNNKINIKRKINEIFASPNYVYKANVNIVTNDGIINKKVIGRNQKNLITMDNEKINIDDIIDINIKNRHKNSNKIIFLDLF